MNSEFEKKLNELSERECTSILWYLWGSFEDNKEFMDTFEKAVDKQLAKRETK
jgi:hypothetical protein